MTFENQQARCDYFAAVVERDGYAFVPDMDTAREICRCWGFCLKVTLANIMVHKRALTEVTS
jgi:hypothetical protein